MNNILSYVKWRGDLSYQQSPFNDVDNLVLSMLAYVDFSDVADADKNGVSLLEAYRQITQKDDFHIRALMPFDIEFFAAAAKSKRFGDMMLTDYVDEIDESQCSQFAAVNFKLGDSTNYIAFRGTDATILGWREDFMMSFQTVSAQKKAVKYLENIIRLDTNYRIGGHSKGGNLAIYASAKASQKSQTQIIDIYNNDGPGLSPELLSSDGYGKIARKVHRIIPEFSVIGNLFEHRNDKTTIVKSSAVGLLQHDGITWEIEGTGFVTVPKNSPRSLVINGIIDDWFESAKAKEKTVFVNNFFDALAASGANKITGIGATGVDGIEAVLMAMIHSEKPAKKTFLKLHKMSWRRIKTVDYFGIIRESPILQGIILFLVCWFVINLIKPAVYIVVIVVVFGILLFAYRQLKKRKK
jgi:hypothetical protein